MEHPSASVPEVGYGIPRVEHDRPMLVARESIQELNIDERLRDEVWKLISHEIAEPVMKDEIGCKPLASRGAAGLILS